MTIARLSDHRPGVELLPDPEVRPWLTVAEVAAHLRVDEDTVYTALREGTLPVPAIRVGRQWRVSTAALRRLAGLDGGVTPTYTAMDVVPLTRGNGRAAAGDCPLVDQGGAP